VLCVLRPLRLVIENYPAGQVEELPAPFYPRDVPREGSRKLPFSRTLLVEREDFAEHPPQGFFRLSPGREVRLRYGYVVRCTGVVKDERTGEVVELRCTYDPATRGGATPDGRKVPGTIHWVCEERSLPVEVRLYDRLFAVERPDLAPGGPESVLNPGSLGALEGCRIEPSAGGGELPERLQFERQGYFFADPIDSRPGRPVFNRIVPLKDSWAKEAERAAPAPRPAPARAAAPGAAIPPPPALSPEEAARLASLRPELEPLVERLLAEHPEEVSRYRAGKVGLFGFFMAQLRQASGATTDLRLASAVLAEKLAP
jgi:glutaminyl-tRNA synthetase